jgi:hypothetical protein
MEAWVPDGERKDSKKEAQVEEGRNRMEEGGRDETDGGRLSWKARRRSGWKGRRKRRKFQDPVS